MEKSGNSVLKISSENGRFGPSEVRSCSFTAHTHLTYHITERGSERRNMYLLPKDTSAPSEAPSSGSQGASAEVAPSQKLTSQPSKSQKSTSKPSKSQKSAPQLSKSQQSVPQPSKSTSQPSKSQNTAPPRPSKPKQPGSQPSIADAPPPTPAPSDICVLDADPASLGSPINVYNLNLDSEVDQEPPPATPESNTIELSQITIDPSQLTIEPSQIIAESSQAVIELSGTFLGSLQHAPGYPNDSAEVPPMDTQSDLVVPSQLPTQVVNVTSTGPPPKARYRVCNPAATPPEKPSSRGSLDEALEMIIDVIEDDKITVDLSDYVNPDSDNESHVSSSEKSVDGCRELTILPPDLQQERTIIERSGESPQQAKFAPRRTLPQLDVDEGDLPTWMVKKDQWKYVASTAGGTAWENLLKIYMDQERRLEFSEGVSNFAHTFHLLS